MIFYDHSPCLLQAYPPGFPVLVANAVSRSRAQQLLQSLVDGNYLDAGGSQDLRVQLLVYNAELKLLGFVQMLFAWTAHGEIEGELGRKQGVWMFSSHAFNAHDRSLAITWYSMADKVWHIAAGKPM